MMQNVRRPTAMLMSTGLVGESLRDGRELILQHAETGSIFGTVRPALLHDLQERTNWFQFKSILCSHQNSHRKFLLHKLWVSPE